MSKRIYLLIVLLVVLSLLIGCSWFRDEVDTSGMETMRGQKVFNRINFRTFEGNIILSSNHYYGGIFIPVGTECLIKGVSKKKIIFYADGREYVLVSWLGNPSEGDIRIFFNKFFVEDTNKIGIQSINPVFSESVRSGIAEINMTKKEILMSLGYPAYLGRDPTYNFSRAFILAQNDWYYLTDRKTRVLLKFKGEKLYRIIE
ncbi:MAG: hypothetical protein KJN62_05470 [Deltaproteobacteria bacterium]|nr:hypothetical protein [Deltaproteobacteria bacterium]